MSQELTPPAEVGADRPPEDDIARLAYSYYHEEGCQEGRAEEHWRRAEEKLRGIPPWVIENGAGDG